jgi:2-phosphoglycerate kinase
VTTEPLVVIGPEGPRPFMRGILVQSLVSRGVPFDLSLDVANRIGDSLAERTQIKREELGQLVRELLGDRYDLEALPSRLEPTEVVGPRGASEPFSKGILAVSLQGSGLETSDAYDVARELEARLGRQGRFKIARQELRDLVSDTIERTHGQRAAARYRVWRQVREDGRPIFLLLGGSTGVGKTSIAVEVARRLEISRVIGSDLIRQIMRLMFSADLMPEIHCSTYDAHQALKPGLRGAGDPVIVGFREQAQKIAVGVHALLDRAVEENTSMILEGVNLLPGLLDVGRYADDAHVIFQVVGTLDLAAYRSRFASRALRARERGSDRYLQHFQEIVEIQNHILGEAERLGLPITDNVRLDETIMSVIRSVVATLEKSLGQSSAAAGS